MKKILIASVVTLIPVLCGCAILKKTPKYTVVIENKSKTTLNAVSLKWGADDRCQFGAVQPDAIDSESFVYYPNGPAILTYYLKKQKFSEEIRVADRIPADKSGTIIITVKAGLTFEVRFEEKN